jgi:hypothetical protein
VRDAAERPEAWPCSQPDPAGPRQCAGSYRMSGLRREIGDNSPESPWPRRYFSR